MGLGNLGSVISAVSRLGFNSVRYNSPPSESEYNQFSHVILPGVGSFHSGMTALRDSGFSIWLKDKWCKEKKPLLGICLGMQLLATRGSEGSQSEIPIEGLDLIPGEIKKIRTKRELLLPHIGWNEVVWINSKNKLISKNIPKISDFYFVHSYFFDSEVESNILAKTSYGDLFPSVVQKDLCIGVQFHPEKSQKFGEDLLKNFLKM